MMEKIRNWFRPAIQPITHDNVDPEPADQDHTEQVRHAHGQLAHVLIDNDRRSWQIRQELASNALTIVSGGKN
jgi:hypothetical protein